VFDLQTPGLGWWIVVNRNITLKYDTKVAKSVNVNVSRKMSCDGDVNPNRLTVSMFHSLAFSKSKITCTQQDTSQRILQHHHSQNEHRNSKLLGSSWLLEVLNNADPGHKCG